MYLKIKNNAYILCIYAVESCMLAFSFKNAKIKFLLSHHFEKAKTLIDCIFDKD